MAYLLLILTVLFWSGNFVLGRFVHSEIPPIALAFWRWTIAGLILMPFVARSLIEKRRLILAHWKMLILLAILSVTNFNTFIYLALHSTTAVNVLLINSITPVFIVCLAWLIFRDRVTPLQAAGVMVSLAGMLWIISRGSPTVLLSITFSKGDLWTLLAALSWACYTILLRKRPAGLAPAPFLAVLIVIGIIFLLPVYLWEIGTGTVARPTPLTMGSVLYVAIFPSILSYLFWNRGVAMVGANISGIFMHLMPVFGIIMAGVFLNERLMVYHYPGILLIVSGIFLTTLRR
jgi:drug/metabolite transporter (DMT)-like permease